MSRVGRLAVVATLVIAGLSSTVPGTAVAGQRAAEEVATPGFVSAEEAAAPVDDPTQEAAIQAVATGEEVVVDELTTPTSRTIASPDGTLVYEESTVPVRVEQDGAWIDVNTDLVLREGWWEPTASAIPVRFTAGGSDEVDQIQTEGGEWVSESWPHDEVLPTPTISGPTATYVEVLPGVDLKLTATKLGMASVYVVKTPAAATGHVMDSLRVELEGVDVTKDRVGNFTAETAAGETLTASSPLWWDSSDGGTSAGPGDTSEPMPVEHEFSDTGLSLDVPETVADADPTYPIFIDPDWSTNGPYGWYTDVAYPNQSYLHSWQSDVLRMGRFEEHRGNIFYQFDIAGIKTKQVLAAHLSTTQLGWASCPNSPIQVKTFGPQQMGFTWNQINNNLWGPVQETKNPGSCGSGPEVVGWNVTPGVQSKIGQDIIQFGLVPENDAAWSRRHFDRAATLYVTYNSPPDKPGELKLTSPIRACAPPEAPSMVGGSNVTVSFNQTDPDPGNVDANVFLVKWVNNNWVSYQQKTAGMGQQGTKSATFTGLPEGIYAWNARGSDWLTNGPESIFCFFNVDNTAPGAPSVTPSASNPSFTIGTPLTVNLSGAADVAGYQYWLSYTGQTSPAPAAPVVINRANPLPNCTVPQGGTRFVCGAGSTPVAISVAPVDYFSTLWVAAYDKAGNVSAAKPMRLYPSNGDRAARMPGSATDGHMWHTSNMSSPLPSSIEDSNLTKPLPLAVPTGIDRTANVQIKPNWYAAVLTFPTTSTATTSVKTSIKAFDATKSFTVSMWVYPENVGTTDQRIAVQEVAGADRMELKITGSKYAFCLLGNPTTADAGKPVSGCATASSDAPAKTWTLVTGVWDAANQQLRILQGPSTTPDGVAAHVVGSGTWTANGPFTLAPTQDANRFVGMIANPVIFPTVLDLDQMAALNDLSSPLF